jgi:hypothetical protein
LPELSSTPSAVKRSAVATNDPENKVRSVSKRDDVEVDQTPQVNASSKNRSVAVRQWPAPKSVTRSQPVDNDSTDSDASPSTRLPSNGRTSAAEAPSLLPPPL